MKVLFVINTLGYGGAEVFTARLTNALVAKKHNITVYVHNYGFDGLAIESSFDKNIAIRYFKLNAFFTFLMWKINALTYRLGFSFKEFVNRVWFKNFVVKEKFDVICNQGIVTDEWLAQLDLPLAMVSTLHEDFDYLYKKQGKFLTDRINNFANRINHFIYLSERSKQYLIQKHNVEESKFTKIYNGFNYPYTWVNSKKETFTFGMIARGTDDKGWSELFKAFEALYVEKKNIRLMAIGGQKYFNNFIEQYQHVPIEFIPATNEPMPYIQQFDVGVLPSIAECLPNFVVECLANSIPVIATDVGEVENMITCATGKAGILVTLTNGRANPEALLAAMRFSIDNEDSFQQLKQHTKPCFANFNMEKCVQAYEAKLTEFAKWNAN
ncbi:MAG: glycosyltransferase family 4 protein [Cyclobacteriaceae bacterium]|nr:glycosyltransferase family 4 protein [Cytophagales bacterium]MCZ8327961.1 glycosyltransferase family 4 protein [Cyclobacteriaceae bacterium]